jgi:hypothetical protein
MGNLKSVYWPFMMATPDLQDIADVLTVAAGFCTAPKLARGLAQIFKYRSSLLTGEQMPNRYEFGIRLLLQVIRFAEQNMHPLYFQLYDTSLDEVIDVLKAAPPGADTAVESTKDALSLLPPLYPPKHAWPWWSCMRCRRLCYHVSFRSSFRKTKQCYSPSAISPLHKAETAPTR